MLPQKHRLPSPEISRVMRSGKRGVGNGIILIHDSRNHGSNSAEDSGNQRQSRFAFIVSTKVDKRAVVRNRVRRLMSESVRHILPDLKKPIDGVFIGSRKLAGLTQKEVSLRVEELLRRI